jgi:hypothetical protein
VLRPLALRLDAYPTPGVCAGLLQALSGMRAGGRRIVTVPSGLAFGAAPAAAPYAIVPGGAAVRYDVEVLRLSRRGPDALFKVGRGSPRRRAAGQALKGRCWEGGGAAPGTSALMPGWEGGGEGGLRDETERLQLFHRVGGGAGGRPTGAAGVLPGGWRKGCMVDQPARHPMPIESNR